MGVSLLLARPAAAAGWKGALSDAARVVIGGWWRKRGRCCSSSPYAPCPTARPANTMPAIEAADWDVVAALADRLAHPALRRPAGSRLVIVVVPALVLPLPPTVMLATQLLVTALSLNNVAYCSTEVGREGAGWTHESTLLSDLRAHLPLVRHPPPTRSCCSTRACGTASQPWPASRTAGPSWRRCCRPLPPWRSAAAGAPKTVRRAGSRMRAACTICPPLPSTLNRLRSCARLVQAATSARAAPCCRSLRCRWACCCRPWSRRAGGAPTRRGSQRRPAAGAPHQQRQRPSMRTCGAGQPPYAAVPTTPCTPLCSAVTPPWLPASHTGGSCRCCGWRAVGL